MNWNELIRISFGVYWVLVFFSIVGILIDWGIKIKNNEEGNEGKDKINKGIRSRLFGIIILIIIGIIGTGIFLI